MRKHVRTTSSRPSPGRALGVWERFDRGAWWVGGFYALVFSYLAVAMSVGYV